MKKLFISAELAYKMKRAEAVLPTPSPALDITERQRFETMPVDRYYRDSTPEINPEHLMNVRGVSA
jgi:hypothetical protein